MTGCYRCGDDDHYSRDCPTHSPSRPVSSDAGTPLRDDPRLRGPAYTQRVPPRRPPEEIGDAAAWSAAIREAMGWDRSSEEKRLRRLAAEQVIEFRESMLLP